MPLVYLGDDKNIGGEVGTCDGEGENVPVSRSPVGHLRDCGMCHRTVTKRL